MIWCIRRYSDSFGQKHLHEKDMIFTTLVALVIPKRNLKLPFFITLLLLL